MIILFEVVLARGQDAAALLSPEVLAETRAKVMTLAEASAVGFSGAQPDPRGLEVLLVAVAPRDARFVQSRLESSPSVASFLKHEVDL